LTDSLTDTLHLSRIGFVGLGQLLMQEAIAFCKTVRFNQVYLWTFAGLTGARHLYEKFGFALTEE
jgi:GNAT superfamily N-acetyltransferase